MKLNNITKIRKEDMSETPDWITKILTPINTFIENVVTALTKNLTFDDNIKSEIKELTLNTDYMPYTVSVSFKPKGVVILQIYQSDNPETSITDALTIDWRIVSEGIKINGISNLTASTDYFTRLLII